MIHLSRADWNADTDLPRRGHRIGPLRRTEVIVHHTAIADVDATPNELGTLDDVKFWMKRLQRIRPDLGSDVPYNMVAFCMSDGDLALCEGRGLDRTGAHTRNHNRSALGIAFHGNFEDEAAPTHIDTNLADLATWLRNLRNVRGFVNLGNSRPKDKQVWGHRDAKSTRTVCPGEKLYDRLASIRFIDEEDEIAMDKSTWKVVQRALQNQAPPLYAGKAIDGRPGKNTNTAVRAFERRMRLQPRGVDGTLGDSAAAIWPATRELLFVWSMEFKDV